MIWPNGSSEPQIPPKQPRSCCCSQFCDQQTWTLDLKLVHVLAQTNRLYIVESSCVLFIIADLNILYVIHLAMNDIFLVCHRLFLNFSWFLLMFLPRFKIFCRNEDEKKRERGRRCWRHCQQWKRNSAI